MSAVDSPNSRRVAGLLRAGLKIAVSVGLIAYLILRVDIDEAVSLLGSARSRWILVATTLLFLTHVLNCWRWRLCLVDTPRRPTGRELAISYATSLSVGLVLPSEFGGDLLRARDMKVGSGSGSSALVSVLWSRASGLSAALLVFGISGLLLPESLAMLSIAGFEKISLVLFAVSVVVLFNRSFVVALDRFVRSIPGPTRFRRVIQETSVAVLELATLRYRGLAILGLAVLAQLFMVTTNYCYSVALGLELSFLDLGLVVPLITVASLIPLSLGGLGVKEGAFVLVLSGLGVAEEGALTLALLNRLVFTAMALLGGMVFPFRNSVLGRHR